MNQRDFLIIASIPFGLVVGSFLNVLIYRLPHNLSIASPGSSCTSCKSRIRWYDNIPVLSYLILLGRCRECKAGISWRYPLVEILTAGLFFAISHTYLNLSADAIVRTLFLIYLVSSMVVLTFIDLDFQILPDKITIPGIVICMVACAVFPHLHYGKLAQMGHDNLSGLVTSFFSAFFGGAMVHIIRFVGTLIFRREAMGFGDVKYMAMLGAVLGWKLIVITFFLACCVGACYGIVLLIVTRQREMAFGPFISVAALVLLFFDRFVLNLLRLGT
jgi:leader peptidase (prepilin peptidase)/N-methyltransferase